MTPDQPEFLREILRRIQDPSAPEEEANCLFSEHILPIVEQAKRRLIARYRTQRCYVEWFEENSISHAWEILAMRPRQTGKRSFDPYNPRGTFISWLMTCLLREAISYCRKKRESTTFFDESSEKAFYIPPPSVRPQELPDMPKETDPVQTVKMRLRDGLAELIQTKPFQPPSRTNGVDYFAVVLILIRIKLAKQFYAALQEKGWDDCCGAKTVELVKEWWKVLDPAWCERRVAQWALPCKELFRDLEDKWIKSNARPLLKQVVELLSHPQTKVRTMVLDEGMRARWATWVARARCHYHRQAHRLSPGQRAILDFLILGADDEQEES
ncbi:MAG: hypothetical protein RMI91_00150 [Gemmatales bacterium]|nr:hypothetical protein [Gemmatales bacterium]MDW7993044.1 hypothetical protein [Gemmatales bacterium]